MDHRRGLGYLGASAARRSYESFALRERDRANFALE